MLAHDYGLALDSPTVNLVIDGMDFVKFCSMIKYYMQLQLRNAGMNNGHPVAYCGDVRIDGVHYSSFEELRVAWERRKSRLHYDNMLFIMSERQIHNEETLRAFDKLEGNKLVLCSKKLKWVSQCVVVLQEFERMFLFQGISGRRYIDKEFHFAKWYKQNSEVGRWNH